MRRKLTISKFLVMALGLTVFMKLFIYIVERFVFQVTGEHSLSIDDSLLDIALVVISALLVLRIIYVIIKYKMNRSTKIASSDIKIMDKTGNLACAVCGKQVSDKVKQYCLDRPERFAGNVLCYNHQKTVN